MACRIFTGCFARTPVHSFSTSFAFARRYIYHRNCICLQNISHEYIYKIQGVCFVQLSCKFRRFVKIFREKKTHRIERQQEQQQKNDKANGLKSCTIYILTNSSKQQQTHYLPFEM